MDIERLVFEALRRSGEIVPVTPEEVARAELELGAQSMNLPAGLADPRALLQHGGSRRKSPPGAMLHVAGNDTGPKREQGPGPGPSLAPRASVHRLILNREWYQWIPWAAGLAAAACLLAAVIWILQWGSRPASRGTQAKPTPGKSAEPPVELAAGWQVQPTGNADYRVMKPDLIHLQRGELLIESRPLAGGEPNRPALSIETPAGTAKAAGTKFYIGTHLLPPKPLESKGAAMSSFTRVLVLAGVVTLANNLGSVTGQADHLLAAETGKAPVNHAVMANSDFALDLYRELSKENSGKNLFFSPYSISTALAMTAEGARGQTAAEMGKVLRFPAAARRIGGDAQLIPWNTSLLHTGMAELNARLEKAQKPVPQELTDKIAELRKQIQASKDGMRANMQKRIEEAKKTHARADLIEPSPDEMKEYRELNDELNKGLSQLGRYGQYEVHVANALWGEKTHPFQEPYLETIHKFYQTGGLFPVDFKNHPETARLEINAWVEKQTHDKIKDLLAPGMVKNDTRMVLTNAIYFRGNWSSQFNPGWTRDQDFNVSAGEKVKAPLMHQTHEYRYWANRSLQALELPYQGGDLSMLVLLPRQADGLAAVEKSLSAARIGQLRAKLQPANVEAFLPKFKLETSYALSDTLQALGMKQAFVVGQADFSGIDGGAGYFFLSLVIHKGFVDVNERGTEAAAATGAAVALDDEARPIVFRADHPFLFLICDNRSGSILFLGRVVSPKE